ncbi:MAG: hypothetical protein UDG94_08740 [Peptococcaceae bacterium]|nr:hypothetical protein [Peptococcaceae bacterium]
MMLNVTSSEPFMIGMFLVLNILFYVAVVSVPVILLLIRRNMMQRMDAIEKELHKLNDLTLRRSEVVDVQDNE